MEQRINVWAVAIIGVVLAAWSGAGAFTGDQEAFKRLYHPAPGTPLATMGCALCHGTSMKALNPYGSDLRKAFAAKKTRETSAFTDIEPLDSDQDGFTNL
jgi:hypothetical protein